MEPCFFFAVYSYMKADSILVGERMVSESQPSNSCQAANRGKHIEKREDAPLMGRWHSHGGQVLVANLTQVHANANTQTSSHGNTQQSTAPKCFKDSFKFIHVPTSISRDPSHIFWTSQISKDESRWHGRNALTAFIVPQRARKVSTFT